MPYKMIIRQILPLLTLQLAIGQTAPLDSLANKLPEVRLSGFHVNDSLLGAPASIAIMAQSDLQRGNQIDIQSVINRVPGVMMQSGALNTNRIIIRGIGARTPYGTNKIRAFFGGIPLTSGDSETTIEDLNTENLESVEIIKGPLSSIYGAGLAGAIVLEPVKPKPGNRAAVSTIHGSFGAMKFNASVSSSSDRSSININHHNLKADGWRQNSAYSRTGMSINGDLLRTNTSRLSYLGQYTYLKAFIPSSITREMLDENPQAAAPTWMASKGYEQYTSWLGGLNYEFDIYENLQNSTSIFLTMKDSYEPRPFNILQEYTTAAGLRSQFKGNISFLRRDAGFIIGAELFQDNYSGNTFENLYQQNNGEGSLQGMQLSETGQRRKFANVFSQLNLPVAQKLKLQMGLNFNSTAFSISNGNGAADQGFTYRPIWSPQASLVYKLTPFQSLYFSASRGFSLPAIEETLTPDNTINTEIRPETGVNLEAGAKIFLLQRRLFLEFAAYYLSIRDLLVARRTGDDQYVGINAGKTLHRGIELSGRYNFNIGPVDISPLLSMNIARFSFMDFVDEDVRYDGNRLPGIPEFTALAGVNISAGGFSLYSEHYHCGTMALNDANSSFSEAWNIINFKAGYSKELLPGFVCSLSLGAGNLTDEKYASMLLVNAVAPANGSARSFYPGMPRNYYLGFSASYRL